MKKNIFIILISLSIADPFKELDKSFLYEEDISNNKTEEISLLKNDCINRIQNGIQEDLPMGIKYLQENSEDLYDFCDCLAQNISTKDLDKIKNSFDDFWIENKKIDDKFFDFFETWIGCSVDLFRGWNEKGILNDMRNDLIAIIEELINPQIEYAESNLEPSNEISQEIEVNKKQEKSENTDTTEKKEPIVEIKPKTKIDKEAFEEKIKDYTKIEGLLTFYIKEDENKALMAIHPDQLEKIYLASFTRQSGDAYYFDGSSMMGEFPIMFKKVGKKIQGIEVNVKFRADKNLAINKAVESHISNSILYTSKIISKPSKEDGSFLVNASDFFITDVGGLSYRQGSGIKFDKSNSYYNYIKSFPNNSEIDVSIHYVSTKPKYKFTLADSRSMVHKYHISISMIPESDYKPRVADDRVGHFTTIYQDYSDTYKESPYVRYINRWDLKKKYPNQNLSEPVEPIVFWIENTVPHEFRDAVKEGILKWNLAFEKIGFKNAIVAKQMPDDADWDPADTRYNTIRWMIQPGSAYAVGPSRANPFTGELYDADIRIGSDYLRFYYTDFVEFIDPIQMIEHDESIDHSSHDCDYQNLMQHKMTYAWNYLTSTNQINNSKKEMKQFVHDGIVDLILHEVGHTLGLRHNFKASSIFSIEQLSNPEFTDQYGVTGSVMDYNATNLFDGGNNYFQTIPGIYDYWAIEYAYSEQSPYSTETESEFLEKIASKSTEPLLAYGTDEDAGSRGIDPYSNRRDMSSNPVQHYAKRIDIGNEFIGNLLENFEKDGDRYPKIRSVFWQGFYEYYGAVRSVAKFIGGIKHSRHHIGQDYDEYPLEIIDVELQKEALDFYKEYIFNKDAFQYSAELLNKMAPERFSDMEGDMWKMERLDFPLHSIVENLQNSALYNLFNYRIHKRIIDNKLKTEGAAFELDYLFSEVYKSIWEELNNGPKPEEQNNINSFRRQLQTLHIQYLGKIYNDEDNKFPHDSESLARLYLGKLKDQIESYIISCSTISFDDYTHAHLLKSLDSINELLDAE